MSRYAYDPDRRMMVEVEPAAPTSYGDDRVTLLDVALIMAGWVALCAIVLWVA